MEIRKKQAMAAIFWRRYSINIDRINRNVINREYAKENSDIPIFSSRELLWHYISVTILHDTPIDYLEFGVFEGDSILKWTQLNTRPESRFYGFDTFTGLPENWFKDFSQGAFSKDGKPPKINDARVSFIKGMFQDTLEGFLKKYQKKNTIVIHIDADLYSSTLFVLSSMHSNLRSGDIVIFDDFLDPLGEFQAFQDYCKSYIINPKLIGAVKYGRFFEKTGYQLI